MPGNDSIFLWPGIHIIFGRRRKTHFNYDLNNNIISLIDAEFITNRSRISTRFGGFEY